MNLHCERITPHPLGSPEKTDADIAILLLLADILTQWYFIVNTLGKICYKKVTGAEKRPKVLILKGFCRLMLRFAPRDG